MQQKIVIRRLAADASPADQSTASALLLGLALRHLCTRLGLPGSELMAMLAHEGSSLDPALPLSAAVAHQLAVIRQVLPEG